LTTRPHPYSMGNSKEVGMTKTNETNDDAMLRCGDALRPCKVLEVSDQLVARGTFAKVMLMDVSEPGLSVTWQRVDRVFRPCGSCGVAIPVDGACIDCLEDAAHGWVAEIADGYAV